MSKIAKMLVVAVAGIACAGGAALQSSTASAAGTCNGQGTNHIFQVGSTGPCVNDIQTMANWQLPYNQQLRTDGKYGYQTKAGIVSVQKKDGVTPYDGIVGPKTWKALCSAKGDPWVRVDAGC